MMEEGKKINFYRLGLENGRRYRMELTDEYRLTGTGGGVFLYLAPVYDSRDRDGSWHRLVLEGDFYRCKYEVPVFAITCISCSISSKVSFFLRMLL